MYKGFIFQFGKKKNLSIFSLGENWGILHVKLIKCCLYLLILGFIGAMKDCTISEFPVYLIYLKLFFSILFLILFIFYLQYKIFGIKSIIQFDLPSIADSLSLDMCSTSKWQEAMTCERETGIIFQVELSCLWK